MKKAKIILTCMAILAIAGGALAFKAKNYTFGPRAYTTTSIISSTVGDVTYIATGTFCVTLPNLFINTVGNGEGVLSTVYSTTLPATSATFATTAPGHATFTRTFPACPVILNTLVTQNI